MVFFPVETGFTFSGPCTTVTGTLPWRNVRRAAGERNCWAAA